MDKSVKIDNETYLKLKKEKEKTSIPIVHLIKKAIKNFIKG